MPAKRPSDAFHPERKSKPLRLGFWLALRRGQSTAARLRMPLDDADPTKQSKHGIFPTFFLSGFECSTFKWKDQKRRDLALETQHREHVEEDYKLLHSL